MYFLIPVFFSVLLALPFSASAGDKISHPSKILLQRTASNSNINGIPDDDVWQLCASQSVQAYSEVDDAFQEINIKACMSGDYINFLLQFPSKNEPRKYKCWRWDPVKEAYVQTGDEREESLCVFLTENSSDINRADMWIWRSCRNDSSGFADDFLCIRNTVKNVGAKTMGENVYEFWKDEGTLSWHSRYFGKFAGEDIPRFYSRTPSGSAADVKACGKWKDGYWTVGFSRKINTFHPDDLDLGDKRSVYLFFVLGLPENLKESNIRMYEILLK